MVEGHEVIILRVGECIPRAAREALKELGFASRMLPMLAEVKKSLGQVQRPILIVDCGDQGDLALQTVKSIIADNSLHTLPVVFVGFEVDSYEKIIDQYFSLAITLGTPCKSQDLVSAVEYIARVYDQFIDEPGEHKVPEAKKEEADPTERARKLIQDAIDSESEQIPTLLFDELGRLNIIKKSVGGAGYTEKIDEAYSNAAGHLPVDAILLDAIRVVCMDAGRWGRTHLYRTAYIACSIAETLQLTDHQIEILKAACFLFSWSFSGDMGELLKKNYSRPGNELLKKELGSRIKDSAMKVAIELKNTEVSDVIAMMGKLIGEEVPVDDSDPSLIASIVLCADLTDRVCYQTGHWNSRSAYHLMRRFKLGFLKNVHPTVWVCIIKFLSESITSCTLAYLLPKHIRENPELIEQARKTKDEEIDEFERKVSIATLEPGMKLSRPLVAFDGKEILAGDIKLDEDLIWRIWQLSAVRPINAPVVVINEH